MHEKDEIYSNEGVEDLQSKKGEKTWSHEMMRRLEKPPGGNKEEMDEKCISLGCIKTRI